MRIALTGQSVARAFGCTTYCTVDEWRKAPSNPLAHAHPRHREDCSIKRLNKLINDPRITKGACFPSAVSA